MRGIRAYINWNHIPDMDTTLASSETIPLQLPKYSLQGRLVFNYLQMIGCTEKWTDLI